MMQHSNSPAHVRFATTLFSAFLVLASCDGKHGVNVPREWIAHTGQRDDNYVVNAQKEFCSSVIVQEIISQTTGESTIVITRANVPIVSISPIGAGQRIAVAKNGTPSISVLETQSDFQVWRTIPHLDGRTEVVFYNDDGDVMMRKTQSVNQNGESP